MNSLAHRAADLLRRIDLGRVHCGQPIGLRDGALLALLASGMSPGEIIALKASDITLAGGRVTVTVGVLFGSAQTYNLSIPLGARVLAWLSARHLLHTAAPVFTCQRGPCTARAITAVLGRYQRPKRKPRRRSAVAVNLLELLALWEGRGGCRPLPIQAIAARLGTSETTIRRRLRALRAAGRVDDRARAHALAARGLVHPGYRAKNPMPDATLRATWACSRSIAGTARNLHVSRRRVQARLEDLGLLAGTPPRQRRRRARKT
jgi:integrase